MIIAEQNIEAFLLPAEVARAVPVAEGIEQHVHLAGLVQIFVLWGVLLLCGASYITRAELFKARRLGRLGD